METLLGSCLCQSVKYEITGEIQGFFLCHCSRCRKVTGSAHASNIFAKVSALNWLSGEDKISRIQVPETRFAKAFCSQCSSALPNPRPHGFVLIPAGSLDSELTIKPQAHIFCESRAKWDENLESLPQFAGLPI
ncbi:MAG: GFA family protein [Pseudobdellovibrionaceae bacterium]|nr:GFA family protein [Pseudobdellovibrionaceae bacterium]